MQAYGINCGRVASPAAVLRCVELGLAGFLDLPGPHARSVAVVGEALRSGAFGALPPRVLAKVGYCGAEDAPPGAATVDGHVFHGLSDAPWAAAQASRAAEVLGRRVDVALLHNPEEAGGGDFGARAAALEAAAAAVSASGAAERTGVSTADVAGLGALLDAAALDAARVPVLRVPVSALDGAAARAAVRDLAARGFDVYGYGPFRAPDAGDPGKPARRLLSPPADFQFSPTEYVDASERVLGHFAPPEGADAETREGCAWVTQLISDLNANLADFQSFEHWELEISSQLVPMLHAKFEELDADSADVLQHFFATYGKAVRATADGATRSLARDAPTPIGDDEPLEAWALRDLKDRPGLAHVSVAVASPEDADALAALLDATTPAPS